MAQPGLFDTIGATPDLLREQLMLQEQKQNQDWAINSTRGLQYGSSPAAAASYQGMQGMSALGRSVGNMLGAEDPNVAKAQRVKKAVEAARSRVADKTDTVAMYEALTQAFSEEGLDQEALQAAEAAQKAKTDKKSIELKEFDIKERTEAAKMRAEAAKAIAEAKALGKPHWQQAQKYAESGKYDPKSVQKYATTGNLEDLEFADKENWSDPYEINIGGKPTLVQKNLKTNKLHDVATGQTVEINLGEKADAAAAGQQFTVDYKDHSTRIQAANDMAPIVRRYKALVESNKIITGTAADARTALERFAVTLGLKEDVSNLTDSQLFDKLVMDLVLPKMQQLGGSDSNEELKKLTEATGDRKMHPVTLKRIAEIMQEQVDKVQRGHEAFRQHLANGGSRLDFDFKTYTPFGSKAVKDKRTTQPAQQPTSSKGPVTFTDRTIQEYMKYYNVGRDEAIKRLEEIAAKRKQ